VVEEYKEKVGDQTIKVEHNERRGYFFSFSKQNRAVDIEKLINSKLIHVITVN